LSQKVLPRTPQEVGVHQGTSVGGGSIKEPNSPTETFGFERTTGAPQFKVRSIDIVL
jgi:hypothetical protein